MYKSKIDWCDSTFNPVTGCRHECAYCYAKNHVRRFGCRKQPLNENGEIAVAGKDYFVTEDNLYIVDKPLYKKTKMGKLIKAHYPFGFAPTFHRYKLGDYAAAEGRTIFVGSMCDLFGKWVPDEWINTVFKACEATIKHRYIFLTKNPKRYIKFHNYEQLQEYKNYWYGTTITNSNDVGRIEEIYNLSLFSGVNTFLSIEPIEGPLSFQFGWMPDWIIIGAETGNRKGKVIPKRKWIIDIVIECKLKGIPVFMKESLREIMGDSFIQEYPWEV